MRASTISMLDLPSIFAHAMQGMKSAQTWSLLTSDYEFICNLSLNNYLNLSKLDLKDIYGLTKEFPIKAYPLQGHFRRWQFSLLHNLFFGLAAKRAKKRGMELVHTRTFGAPKYTIAMGLPTVVEVHSPPDDKPQRVKMHSLINEPLFLCLVTNTEEVAQAHRDIGLPAHKILPLHNGVDLIQFGDPLSREQARLELGIDPKGPWLVYAGHLYKGRGIEQMLEAAQTLPEVNFLLVGGHPEDVNLRKDEVAKRELRNVEITGFVNNSNIPKYLWAADILLMPYETSCPTYDHMSPLKMFEYLAAGRPILASDLPALRNVLQDGKNAVLCAPDDPKALIAGIERMLASSTLRETLTKNALKDAENHSLERRVRLMLEFCEEAIKDLKLI